MLGQYCHGSHPSLVSITKSHQKRDVLPYELTNCFRYKVYIVLNATILKLETWNIIDKKTSLLPRLEHNN